MKKVTNCFLCKKKSQHLITKSKQPTKIFPTKNYKNFSKKNLNVYFCKSCLYCFQYPLPSEKQINKFYKDEQSEYISLVKNPILGAEKEKEKINFIINCVKKNFKKNKLNIVEVGGFDGYIVREVSKKFNAKSFLIEPNKTGANIASKENIIVKNSYLEKNSIQNMQGLFDVVICKHVIEHVKYLDAFVRNLKKLLNKNGILIIETPDLNMIFKKSLTREFILQHLHYFSIFTLKKIFKDFSILNYRTTKQENSLIVAFSQNQKKKIVKKYNLNKKIFLKNLKKNIVSLNSFCKKNFKKNVWIYGASSSVNDIFSLYKVKKKFIHGIIDTDINKLKMRLPIQKDLKIIHFSDKTISKSSAIIVVASAKKAVMDNLKNNGFAGPKYLFQ